MMKGMKYDYNMGITNILRNLDISFFCKKQIIGKNSWKVLVDKQRTTAHEDKCI